MIGPDAKSGLYLHIERCSSRVEWSDIQGPLIHDVRISCRRTRKMLLPICFCSRSQRPRADRRDTGPFAGAHLFAREVAAVGKHREIVGAGRFFGLLPHSVVTDVGTLCALDINHGRGSPPKYKPIDQNACRIASPRPGPPQDRSRVLFPSASVHIIS